MVVYMDPLGSLLSKLLELNNSTRDLNTEPLKVDCKTLKPKS